MSHLLSFDLYGSKLTKSKPKGCPDGLRWSQLAMASAVAKYAAKKGS